MYNGSGVMPGRTWVIAPDAESLEQRWKNLIDAPGDQKELLFHPHLDGQNLGDRHSKRVIPKGLPGFEARNISVADDRRSCIPPIRYGFRSFDRQWIIPDNRLINRPNPEIWTTHSEYQIYITAFTQVSPSSGPAVTFTALIPDLHHYKGSFGGRVFPLWRDRQATTPNIQPKLLEYLSTAYGLTVHTEDLVAYIAAVAAHPAFTAKFKSDLIQPGLRIPLTAEPELFAAAAELGRTVIWLHTFGERFADPAYNRPAGPPRLPSGDAPRIPVGGAIPQNSSDMPDTIDYDSAHHRLLIGRGYVENVSPQVWNYEVSGKKILRQWFSYRKANRERPIMGDRRPPSPLGDIRPDHWLAEYTTELINLLNVLGMLVALEPSQADLLERICSAPTITAETLHAADVLSDPSTRSRKGTSTDMPEQMQLLD